MNPTWTIVLGALVAGAVGGFMVPVRPEIRDVPALTKTAEPVNAEVAAQAAPASQPGAAKQVRVIPLTDPAGKVVQTDSKSEAPKTQLTANPEAPKAQQTANPEPPKTQQTAATPPCSVDRTPTCLDRTASVPEPDVTLNTKTVAPKIGLKETAQPAAKQETKTAQPAVKQETKAASAPASGDSGSDQPRAEAEAKPAPKQASTDTDEQAESARAAPAKRAASRPDNSRPARRSARRPEPAFRDGIPTRVYLRGPDGRLYLAPEYRFGAPSPHYASPPYYVR